MKNILKTAGLLLVLAVSSCSNIYTRNNCKYAFDWNDKGIDSLNTTNLIELDTYKRDCYE